MILEEKANFWLYVKCSDAGIYQEKQRKNICCGGGALY